MTEWKARDVRDALRRRHPAEMHGSMVGQWTCIEEWADIDLLALNAWAGGDVIGYEVKVSRADYRAELMQPTKRAEAVAMCTQFFFAVPAGLLKADEIAYDEPRWTEEDWHRMRCPGIPAFGPPSPITLRRHRPDNLLDTPPGRYGGPCTGRGRTGTFKGGRRERGPFTMRLPVPLTAAEAPDYVTTSWERVGEQRPNGTYETARVPLVGENLDRSLAGWLQERIESAERAVPCPLCGGKGYLARSRVEVEAPTLWVPRDVGLVEVHGGGTRVVRKSPMRGLAPGLIQLPEGASGRVAAQHRQRANKLARWCSNRPDPRHLPVEVIAHAA